MSTHVLELYDFLLVNKALDGFIVGLQRHSESEVKASYRNVIDASIQWSSTNEAIVRGGGKRIDWGVLHGQWGKLHDDYTITFRYARASEFVKALHTCGKKRRLLNQIKYYKG